MVVHAFNRSTWEVKTGGFVSSRLAWFTEFQDSQGYTDKTNKNKTKHKEWQSISCEFGGIQ